MIISTVMHLWCTNTCVVDASGQRVGELDTRGLTKYRPMEDKRARDNAGASARSAVTELVAERSNKCLEPFHIMHAVLGARSQLV